MAKEDRKVTLSLLMKCDKCDETATVFYTQVTDGKLKKIAFCEACADQSGITDPSGLMMPEELLQQSAEVAGEEAFPETADPHLACPTCEFTLENLQKVGRLGCPDCYDVFSGTIGERLGSLHKGIRHTGYQPKGLAGQHALRTKLGEIDEKLAEAIEKEDYEEAARLRDELVALKSTGQEVSS